jgi:single-strand DNA-binding protein
VARGVIVHGRLKQRSFETKEGEKRIVWELEADEVGPSLRYATVKINKAGRGSGTGTGSVGGTTDDPWAAGVPVPEEPPF